MGSIHFYYIGHHNIKTLKIFIYLKVMSVAVAGTAEWVGASSRALKAWVGVRFLARARAWVGG